MRVHVEKPAGLDAAHMARLRASFMSRHPVLAALDADHDGVISTSEIRNAPAALLTLDRNLDGKLVESELRPDPRELQARGLMLHFNRNGDGKISADEAPRVGVIAELLKSADSNHDGIVTLDELIAALSAH